MFHPEIFIVLETRINPYKPKDKFSIMGFDEHVFSLFIRFSGGIAMGGIKEKVNVMVELIHFQFIHSKVTLADGWEWLFTLTYSSPKEGGNIKLWENLKNIVQNVRGGWIIGGNFNDILSASEKIIGAKV